MAKKQTRRTVSLRGSTYRQVREHCSKMSLSMSNFIEARIAEYFRGRDVIVPETGATATTRSANRATQEVAAPNRPKAAAPSSLVGRPPPQKVPVSRAPQCGMVTGPDGQPVRW